MALAKRKVPEDVKAGPTGELWTPAMLATFLAQNASRPQSDFRKIEFFKLLGGDASALLQAFLETKNVRAQKFFYQQPWPGRDEKGLIPASPRWKDRVREYMRLSMRFAGTVDPVLIARLNHGTFNGVYLPTNNQSAPTVVKLGNGSEQTATYQGNAAFGGVTSPPAGQPHADQRPLGGYLNNNL
jgi:hypothetical protein